MTWDIRANNGGKAWLYCSAYMRMMRVEGLTPIRDRWCCCCVRGENRSGQRQLNAATCNRRQVKVKVKVSR
jgi:hypothetical protein